MRRLAAEAGLAERLELDSAGTGAWHVGEPADARSRAAARRRGLELVGRARQLTPADLHAFDLVLAIDRGHLRHLEGMLRRHGGRAEARCLRSFDPAAVAAGELDVPDPYYGDGDGFELVLDQCEAACRGLLAHVAARLAPEPPAR